MNTEMTNSFGAELSRIAANLRESAVWPSPATGLGLQILKLCDCDERRITLLGATPFPQGPLDEGPAAAAAGFAMAVAEPKHDELSRWREAVKRLVNRDPFPRDRQTFVYRPSESVGLAIGILVAEGRNSGAAAWLRTILQELPGKSPPTNAWALLLYHYAAAILGFQFPLAIPGRLSEYDTTELGLLVALLEEIRTFNSADFEPSAVQSVLLARVITESPNVRDTERLAALYGSLSMSLKARLLAPSPFDYSSPLNNTTKMKILFLAANPTGTTQLALDEECRQITEKIRAADHRDSLELITRWAVRPEDLLQHFNQHKPHVVHFSGHGTRTEEIVLLDKDKNPKPIPAPALRQLFATLKDNIRVVVLNACFSKSQAAAITDVVDCAIGMNKAIGDDAAITFAAAFYQAIGFGRSVKVAFESGKTALMLEGIPEEKTPDLICGTDVDPAAIVLVEPNFVRRVPR